MVFVPKLNQIVSTVEHKETSLRFAETYIIWRTTPPTVTSVSICSPTFIPDNSKSNKAFNIKQKNNDTNWKGDAPTSASGNIES